MTLNSARCEVANTLFSDSRPQPTTRADIFILSRSEGNSAARCASGHSVASMCVCFSPCQRWAELNEGRGSPGSIAERGGRGRLRGGADECFVPGWLP